MELTKRQEEFVRSMLELYGELQEPFHYSELAERLGVSRFTAYDMLRVLEEKGIVSSHYRLDEERGGPGRSVVMYEPTPRARRILADVFSATRGQDWEAVKERLLQEVLHGGFGDAEMAQEMLARTPPDESPALRYCIEVMTVIALRLRRHDSRQLLLEHLERFLSRQGSSCRSGLSLLGGFALGVLAEEDGADEAWEQELLDHVWQYETLVVDMDAPTCRRLAARLEEVFAPLSGA
ncbi:MAG: HTH domain-containing protein [Anaerolineae bacterium]|nr:HTH domain-containing protein [Anaerolineae bacterium]